MMPGTLRRAGKYGVVGLSGLVLVTLVFWLLHERLGMFYIAAGLIANEAGICNNFVLNNRWTFSDRRISAFSLRGLARYHLVSLSGIGLHTAVLVTTAGLLSIQPTVGNLLAATAAAAWSYVFNNLWTWRHTKHGLQSAAGAIPTDAPHS